MNLLLDTQILLWLTVAPERLTKRTFDFVRAKQNRTYFSPVSLVEVAIKRASRSGVLLADPDSLRTEWLIYDISELAVTSDHAIAVDKLPMLHKDPFDRLLLAKAIAENMTLLTADDILTRYPTNVRDAR